MKGTKICLMILSLLMLTGCTAFNEDNQKQQDLITVGFSQVGAESDWRVANTESMLHSLSEENGYELFFSDAKQKQENQFKAIRTFIQQEVDYIVLAPVTERGWESVLEEAYAAGIPVIIVDRQVDVDNQKLYCSWVGSDFRKEADMAVSWLRRELISQNNQNEEINILHLKGTEGSTAQLQRSIGLEEALQNNTNWRIAAQLCGEFTQAKAYEETLAYLRLNRDIDVIYSENDNMTFGAMQAMDELGISYGVGGDVIIISFDAVHTAMEYCLEGKINLCVECNPLHGPKVEEIIEQMENGIKPQKQSYVLERWYASNNVSQAIIDEREY